jgi:NitT/TauT family transport system substrate-binding protein
MLEDGIFVQGKWLQDSKNQETAKKFLKASFVGWIYCRDHMDECVQFVLKNGSTLGAGHQTWQMNEINALVWPSPKGIGIMDGEAYRRTAQIAQDYGVIKRAPDRDAFRTDLAESVLHSLKDAGYDVHGENYEKSSVQITPGGK